MQTGRGYRRSYRGLTLFEVLVVSLLILAILLLALILWTKPSHKTPDHVQNPIEHGETETAATLEARRVARRMQNSTQLRGIYQGLFVFASSNNGHFPGLDSQGNVVNGTVEYRFQLMLEGDFFTPEYAISPLEIANITAWVEFPNSDSDTSVTLTTENYSYAMLDMDQPGGRQAEWSQTLNPDAIVLADRNTSRNAQKPTSYHSGNDPWEGTVLWNDNHIGFEKSHILATAYTNPTSGSSLFSFPSDNIFDDAGLDDAWLIYSGD